MNRILCILFGFVPIVIGYGMNYILQVNDFMIAMPFLQIGIVTLCVWGIAAFLFGKSGMNRRTVIVCMNFAAFICLLLIGVQELGHYWPNHIGFASQFFYLPFTRLGMHLLFFTVYRPTFLIKCVSFLLLLLVSFVGCKCSEKRMGK